MTKMKHITKPEAYTATRGVRVYHIVFEDLQKRIRRGDWLPGERLPGMTKFAEELNVSVSSLREALRSLQSIGLVKIVHGSGVYIANTRPSTDLSSHFLNENSGLAVALAETRRVIEPELAALAAKRGTETELKEVKKLAQEMDQYAREGKDFAELDVKFHSAIAQAAGNPILYKTLESVRDLFLSSRRAVLIDSETIARSAYHHMLIVDALIARNAAQAKLLMQTHMNSMLDDVLATENHRQQLKDKS